MESPTKGGPSDGEFVWEDYLEEKNAKAIPPTAFTHVEHSLSSSFNIGMKLEILNGEEMDKYWIASVIVTAGPLLSLRYLGDDRNGDFWFDVNKEFHPIGWCKINGKILYPPKSIREKFPNYEHLLALELENTAGFNPLLSKPGCFMTPVDQIKNNMVVEVQDEENYLNIWPARIIQNVGGRLQLRYEYSMTSGTFDFWLFYLSERIHSLGWASDQELVYTPPKGRGVNLENVPSDIAWNSLKQEEFLFPDHVLEPQLMFEFHNFEVGMKLEVLHPLNHLDLRLATVIEVLDDRFFIIDVDNLEENNITYPHICCHSFTSTIFPCGWAEENNLILSPPDGYREIHGDDFNWKTYLAETKAVAAPNNLFSYLMNLKPSIIEVGMKLEAVNPFFKEEIHVSTVIKKVEPLIWIQIDSTTVSDPHHATIVNSLDIFPVGWCASNSYPLLTPPFTKHSVSIVNNIDRKENIPEPLVKSKPSVLKDGISRKAWCPVIFFNHCCFSGPFLSKSRLAELPQKIGPGPIDLVMREVMTNLINIAYKSSQVIRELQMSGRPRPDMFQQTIKAKYKGKSFKAVIELVQDSDQVANYCRQICMKLDCCPHLFGPTFVGKNCPEKCHSRTKTTFTNGLLKNKKKVELSSSTNSSIAATEDKVLKQKVGPGRKKKRKHWRHLLANSEKSSISEIKQEEENNQEIKNLVKEPTPQSSDINNSDHEVVIRRKRKKLSSFLPKSDIVTRGAKTPKYWRHHSTSANYFSRRGRPPIRHLSVLQKKIKRKGRPPGSKNKTVHVAKPNSAPHTSAPINPIIRLVLNDSSNMMIPPNEFQEFQVASNPLHWNIDETIEFVKKTSCAPIAPLLKENDIDGQAFLLLNLHFVEKFFRLSPSLATKLCSLVEHVKYTYFAKYN